MPRPPLAFVSIIWSGAAGLVAAFKTERLRFAAMLALAIFILAMVFAFLAFTPFLSPFIYPLF